MCSDNLSRAGLLPDYNIPAGELFQKLVRYLLSGQVFVTPWGDMEMAVIKSKGCILGKVAQVDTPKGGQKVKIILKYASGHLEQEVEWALQASAKSIQLGDLVCFLQGATNPTVIRPCKDYFYVIKITVPSLETESRSVGLPEQPLASFPHEFLLVWDWKWSQGELQDEEYETLIKGLVSKHSNREIEGHSDKMTRLWNVALILEDAEEYEKAEKRLRETADGTLTGVEKRALLYKKMEQWEEAEKLFKQVIQTRKRLLKPDHPDTISCMANLASMYKDQGHSEEVEKLEAMINILELKGDNAQITEEEVVKIAGLFDGEVMELLLARKGNEVQITEGVVIAAARNEKTEVMQLLLDRKGNEVQITEGVVIAAAGNKREVMQLLLNRKGNEVQITEDVVIAAAENKGSGEYIIQLLLDRKGNEVQITKGVVMAAAGNRKKVMQLLFDQRGNEVLRIAAAGSYWGEGVMQLLLDRKGSMIQITEGIIIAAAGNKYSGEEVTKLLLDWKENEVHITEGVVRAAAGNELSGKEVIQLLLDRKGNKVQITEDMVMAAAGAGRNAREVMRLLRERRGDLASS
jgi:tetratricopeptide (TPR) repeat protein